MRPAKPALPFEECAESFQATVTVWRCKTCKRQHNAEYFARRCCVLNKPCETADCQNRVPGDTWRSLCDGCYQLATRKRWEALADSKPYDGSPVCLFDDDQFFWTAYDLGDYLAEQDHPEDTMLVFAENRPARWTHEVGELLSDNLADDCEWDTSEIDATVAEWVEKNAPACYWPTKIRVELPAGSEGGL